MSESWTLARLGERCLQHLRRAVAIDTQSDETSSTIPSTEGQREFAGQLVHAFRAAGARVEQDPQANVIARFDGRGAGAQARPLALMAHLDTSRGTQALDSLIEKAGWDGHELHYPANPALKVDTKIYPSVAAFVGHTIVHGPGDRPFGLDDKLGLAQMLTLADVLEDSALEHPPLVMVARPDEEIGRMAAVESLADVLSAGGVRYGFTIDGILPFEINVENFNASQASVWFPARAGVDVARDALESVRVQGVNTHGATAKAEGYRAATRLAAEWAALSKITVVDFESDELRDCDAVVTFHAESDAWLEVLERVVGPHRARGASYEPLASPRSAGACGSAPGDMLEYVHAFLNSSPGFVVAAEDSDDRDGYSAPYRARRDGDAVRLDIRLRDFEQGGLRQREKHVVELLAGFPGARQEVTQQYVNMGPHLAAHPPLTEWPREAAKRAGEQAVVRPIRGGTGVDPFLERGVLIGNVGTGYFAPESEKELTSREMMARHVRWLIELVQVAARGSGRGLNTG